MKVENVISLLEAIGARKIRVAGDKVLATCPLEHEHASGKDNSPSFVVFAKASEESMWHCSYPHADNRHTNGRLDHLVRLFARSRALPYATTKWGNWEDDGFCLQALLKFVWEHDCTSVVINPLKKKLKPAKKWDPKRNLPSLQGRFKPLAEIPEKELMPALPGGFLDRFEEPEGDLLRYLREERGLYDYTISQWELSYDSDWDRLVIPLRDSHGELIAISRRALRDYQTPKYQHMKGFKRRYYMFGENPKALDPVPARNRRGIIVEGQFDVIRLWQYGYRGAVAMYGADMTEEQITKFKSLFAHGVALTDGDEAGVNAGIKLQAQFSAARIPLEVVNLPEGLDAGDTRFTKEQAISILGQPEVDSDWEL